NSNNQLLTETRFVQPDPDQAGPLQPWQPLTTHYVYDSENHLRFVISAEGRVTEYQYNTPGLLVMMREFTSGSYAGGGFLETDLQTWAAAQPLTKLQRTDYAYDFRGNLSSTTSYFTTNASGAGAGTPSIIRFI